MKNWRVDYSTKFIDGSTEEEFEMIEAENITIALGIAVMGIIIPAKEDPTITNIVIWSVSIVEDDVF